MPFPISIEGKIIIDNEYIKKLDIENILNCIEDMLYTERASSVSKYSASIKFTSNMFRITSSWNILSPINSGVINANIETNKLYILYSISLKRTFILSIIMTTILALISNEISRVKQDQVVNFSFSMFLSFVFLFGGNYILSFLRFPLWVERGIRDLVSRNELRLE